MNRKVLSYIHGKDLIGDEFFKIFTTMQCFSASEPSSTTIKNYIDSSGCILSSNNKKRYVDNSFKILSKKEAISDELLLSKLKIYLKCQKIGAVYKAEKITFKGHVYTTRLSETKYCDYCIESLSNGKFGLIDTFILFNDKLYIYAKKLSKLTNPFVEKNLNSRFTLCFKTDEFLFESIENVKKIVFMDISTTDCFISRFSISHLFT